MHNERILIFGDSYSTFAGYIPEGYDIYYPSGVELGVMDVTQTWWHMLADETNSEVVHNNSWSGSTICNTGYNGDCSETSSFIHRLNEKIDSGFFADTPLDRVLVFGGTNDSWTGNACGEIMYDNWTAEDLLRVLPGISYFTYKLQTAVPAEKIHFIINTELRPEITEGIAAICDHYGISYTVLSDIDKFWGHPTAKGMVQIKEQVKESLK